MLDKANLDHEEIKILEIVPINNPGLIHMITKIIDIYFGLC